MKLLSSRHAAAGASPAVQKTKRLPREPKEPPSTTLVVQVKLSSKGSDNRHSSRHKPLAHCTAEVIGLSDLI